MFFLVLFEGRLLRTLDNIGQAKRFAALAVSIAFVLIELADVSVKRVNGMTVSYEIHCSAGLSAEEKVLFLIVVCWNVFPTVQPGGFK